MFTITITTTSQPNSTIKRRRKKEEEKNKKKDLQSTSPPIFLKQETSGKKRGKKKKKKGGGGKGRVYFSQRQPRPRAMRDSGAVDKMGGEAAGLVRKWSKKKVPNFLELKS